jgi:hypothetical protein
MGPITTTILTLIAGTGAAAVVEATRRRIAGARFDYQLRRIADTDGRLA